MQYFRAHRLRKGLGGAMRQVGIIAAAGLVALDTIVPGLDTDHAKVRRIAEGKFLFLFVTKVLGVVLNGFIKNLSR